MRSALGLLHQGPEPATDERELAFETGAVKLGE